MRSSNYQELLSYDYFKLFQLNSAFKIDQVQLKETHRNLQKQFHPDNFTNNDKTLQMLNLQLSSHINNGYTTLSSPLNRALYLLKLNGFELNLETDTTLPSKFLIDQMELHEKIAEAKTQDQLENLEQELQSKEHTLVEEIATAFENANFIKATELVKQLAFIKRLLDNISQAINRLWI